MKPSDTESITQPFFIQGNLSITTLNQGGKIFGWVVKNGKGEKQFLTKGKILATWKKVEKYVNQYL